MRINHQFNRVVAAATATLSLLLINSAPTFAAAPPSCVTTALNDSGAIDLLVVTNNCTTAKRVKVVLAFGTDISCRTIQPGGSLSVSWGYPRRFDRLESC